MKCIDAFYLHFTHLHLHCFKTEKVADASTKSSKPAPTSQEQVQPTKPASPAKEMTDSNSEKVVIRNKVCFWI